MVTQGDYGLGQMGQIYGADNQLGSNVSMLGAAGGMGGGPFSSGPSSKRPKTGHGGACNTLYVSNMSSSTSENEIRDAFSMMPGFVQVVFARKVHRLFAFVEYEHEEQATAAMNTYNGHCLPSNTEASGLAIVYSRDPIKKRPNEHR